MLLNKYQLYNSIEYDFYWNFFSLKTKDKTNNLNPIINNDLNRK